MPAPFLTRGSISSHLEMKDASASIARHGAGSRLPLHAHPVSCLVLVVSGGFVEILEGRTCSCRQGDILLRPADAPHANRYGDDGASFVVIEIPDRIVSTLDRSRELFSRIRVFRSDEASAWVRRIRSALRGPDTTTSQEIDELLVGLLGSVLPEADEPAYESMKEGTFPPWLRTVYDRIYTEFRSRPPMTELADAAAVHPDHVSRSFRRHFGFTISDLVRRRRVEHAAHRIRNSDRRLAWIAYEAGFSDQSHMTREVRRYLGVTPLKLRHL